MGFAELELADALPGTVCERAAGGSVMKTNEWKKQNREWRQCTPSSALRSQNDSARWSHVRRCRSIRNCQQTQFSGEEEEDEEDDELEDEEDEEEEDDDDELDDGDDDSFGAGSVGANAGAELDRSGAFPGTLSYT
jgi:hypothetical protein